MPIAVSCPGCSATLNAPDSAAGKKVKCPKPGCGTLMIIPDALEPEFEVEAKPVLKPKPKPIKAAIEDEDEPPRKKSRRDDDDDDDRPRKKKRKQKAAGMAPGLLAGIVIGAILILGGAGYGIYALVSSKDDKAGSGGGGGAKAAVPAGWVEHRSESDKFKAYFPVAPQSNPFKPPGKLPPAQSVTLYTSGSITDDRLVILYVAQLPPGASEADKKAYEDGFLSGNRAGVGAREGTGNWGGRTAKEIVINKPATKNRPESGIVVRQVTVGNFLYGAIITTNKTQPSPEMVNGFFDNFEFLN